MNDLKKLTEAFEMNHHSPVSYSALKKYLQDGIRAYVDYKEREQEESSRSMDLGTAVETKLFYPEKFKEEYFLLPDNVPSSENQIDFFDLCLKGVDIVDAYKQCYKNAGKKNETVKTKAEKLLSDYKEYMEFKRVFPVDGFSYSVADSKKIAHIEMEAMNHKVIRTILKVLREGEQEGESYKLGDLEIYPNFYFSVDINEVPVHGEMDLLVINHASKTITIYDVKTTAYPVMDFEKTVGIYDYDIQAWIYYSAAKRMFPDMDYGINFPRFIVLRTTEPYTNRVASMTPHTMNEAAKIVKPALENLKWQYLNNELTYDKEYVTGSGITALKSVR